MLPYARKKMLTTPKWQRDAQCLSSSKEHQLYDVFKPSCCADAKQIFGRDCTIGLIIKKLDYQKSGYDQFGSLRRN